VDKRRADIRIMERSPVGLARSKCLDDTADKQFGIGLGDVS
jgi:hypothetical protein